MPLVSNIYYNLPAWASGTFTTGQRRSNAGNAYQCVTGGTGTIAPTGTGSSINGGGGVVWKYLSSVDYTDVQSWGAAIPATLTQAVVGQIWNTGAITTTSGNPFFTLSGHTTSPTNTITLTAAPGESFVDTLAASPTTALNFNAANGVAFSLPATGVGGINYMTVNDDHFIMTRIQVQDPNSSSGSTILSTFENSTINQCLFDGYAQTGGASMLSLGVGGSGTTNLINTVVIDREPAPGTGCIAVSCGNTFNLAGYTHFAPNSPGDALGTFNASASPTVCDDSIIIGYPGTQTIGSGGGGTTNVSYMVISDASLSGTGITVGAGMQYSKTGASQFVSASGTYNFRLAGTASAHGAGVVDTTLIPAGNDILGTLRGATWDIGAYQIPSVASVGTASGVGTASATGAVIIRSSGAAAGKGTASAVSQSTQSVGTASGVGTASAVSATTVAAVGTASGIASAIAYNAAGAIDGIIHINPIPTIVAGAQFLVSGTFTILPLLQFADDSSTTFSPIPVSDISPLGSTPFSFIHPGEAAPGQYQLIITDATTGATASALFTVVAAPEQITSAFPPTGPTGLTQIIPSYLYQEYNDDDNLQALVTAQNMITQAYLDQLLALNLPIYPGLSGALLDWVALGLYGMERPNLSTATSSAVGPFNTYPFDTLAMAVGKNNGTTQIFNVTDDLFKRMITWNFFKGDGFTFTTEWLKRRVMRFLGGTNGIDYGVSETYQVSVTFTGSSTINITIKTGSQPTTYVPILAAAIQNGVCQLPFMYTYNILQG